MGRPQELHGSKGRNRVAPPSGMYGMIMAQPWPCILQQMDPCSVRNAHLFAFEKQILSDLKVKQFTRRQRLWLVQTGIWFCLTFEEATFRGASLSISVSLFIRFWLDRQ